MNTTTIYNTIPLIGARISAEVFGENSSLDWLVVSRGDGKVYPIINYFHLFYDLANMEGFADPADGNWRGSANRRGHALRAARVVHPANSSSHGRDVWFRNLTGDAWLHCILPAGVADVAATLHRRGAVGVSTSDRRTGRAGARHTGWTSRIRDLRAVGMVISATRDERRYVFRLHSWAEFKPPTDRLPVLEITDLITPYLPISVQQYMASNEARVQRQAINAAKIVERFTRHISATQHLALTPATSPTTEAGANV